MERRYWLQRISHESEISYKLLDNGYLSIGWRDFMNTDILERINSKGKDGFDEIMRENNETSRSRFVLWHFAQFRTGDWVVVPLPGKKFRLVEVVETAFPASKLSCVDLCVELKESVEIKQDGIYKNDKHYDIGFLIKVKDLRGESIPREYADAKLVSRMKIRQANADINDIACSVKAALNADKTADIHGDLIDAASKPIRDVIDKHITPDKLERLVKWYMEKMGASKVEIPSKNEEGKENGADADVIAEFENLKIIFYIQVKCHIGETNEWAVEQISEYKNQKESVDGNYTYIPWVISTADSYSKEAEIKAEECNVHLINGEEFSHMLMDCGLDGIDSILQ